MIIIALMLILVGLVLGIVGAKLTTYLPPNFAGNDDEFLALMNKVGSLLKMIGIFVFIVGVIGVLMFR